MTHYVELKDGIWQQVHNLEWLHEDGTPFSEEDYNNAGYYVLENNKPEGDFVLVEIETNDNEFWELREDNRVHVTYTVTPRDIDFIKRMAVSELNSNFEQFVHDVKADYPDTEIDTWPTQREEINAWRKDPDAHTPLLDGIAMARGIEPNVLKNLAAAQVDAYTSIMGTACGLRQKYRDDIYAEEDPEKIVEIARTAIFYVPVDPFKDAPDGTSELVEKLYLEEITKEELPEDVLNWLTENGFFNEGEE